MRSDRENYPIQSFFSRIRSWAGIHRRVKFSQSISKTGEQRVRHAEINSESDAVSIGMIKGENNLNISGCYL